MAFRALSVKPEVDPLNIEKRLELLDQGVFGFRQDPNQRRLAQLVQGCRYRKTPEKFRESVRI